MVAAYQTYRMTLGVDLVSASGLAWEVAGINIDNPSGSWLLVKGIEQYVPPYTNGWQYPLIPQQASVTVRFVDSPSGSQSSLIGDPPVVTLYNEPVGPSQGFPSGAGARVSIVPLSQVAFAPVGAVHYGELDAPQTVIAANVGERLIIRRLSILPDLSYGLADFDPAILATVQVIWDIFPSLTFSWYQAITPESVYVNEIIEEGAIVIPPTEGLRVRAYIEDHFVMADGATAGVIAQCQYYAENT
jgi:hypothetical protein